MEIILKEDIPTLGKAGEVVKVRDGYGRNFLLPQKKAILATQGNLQAIAAQKRMIDANLAKLAQNAQEVSGRLNGLEVTIERPVGTNDRLFGSVTKLDVATALRAKGIQIDKSLIQIDAPIKTIGTFDVTIKLHHDIHATIKLWVIRETKK